MSETKTYTCPHCQEPYPNKGMMMSCAKRCKQAKENEEPKQAVMSGAESIRPYEKRRDALHPLPQKVYAFQLTADEQINEKVVSKGYWVVNGGNGLLAVTDKVFRETYGLPGAEPDITLIPLDKCPPELRYLSKGKTVGLRVEGKLTEYGVEVGKVEFLR